MFSIFTCTHPLKYLAVQKESSEVKLDEVFQKLHTIYVVQNVLKMFRSALQSSMVALQNF
jgi:hypothetical protein